MAIYLTFRLFAGAVSQFAKWAACIMVLSLASLSAAALDNWQYVSDEMLIRVAERSWAMEAEKSGRKAIAGKRDANSPESGQRIEDVRQFLLSVEGDSWYRNWVKQFAPPRSVEERVYANLVGNTDGKLG